MKHYLLIKSPLFTYDLGRGGPPPTQRTNLRFAQIVEDLKNFNFGRPMLVGALDPVDGLTSRTQI